jgi:hypothetical protein
MPDNRRIHFACHQIGFMPEGAGTFTAAHGVQSLGITTDFNLDQVFELGQLAIYDNIEQIPDISITCEKVLDGHPLLYHLATANATSGTLVGRSNQRTTVGVAVFSDTLDATSGAPLAEVVMSGAVISSLNYAFPVDGNSTESVTLVCNDKLWRDSGMVFTGAFAGNDDAPIGSGGTQQRSDLIFAVTNNGSGVTLDENSQYIALSTILPTDIYGIDSHGRNPFETADHAHIQGITISCDLGRDQIFELGKRAPYFRYVTFPIEVTTEITFIGTKWDGISGNEAGGNNGAPPGSNLKNQSIRVYTADGTFITTGTKNKLRSTGYSGGDAGGGGGNVTITNRYSTFNELTVKHPADPTVALR